MSEKDNMLNFLVGKNLEEMKYHIKVRYSSNQKEREELKKTGVIKPNNILFTDIVLIDFDPKSYADLYCFEIAKLFQQTIQLTNMYEGKNIEKIKIRTDLPFFKRIIFNKKHKIKTYKIESYREWVPWKELFLQNAKDSGLDESFFEETCKSFWGYK